MDRGDEVLALGDEGQERLADEEILALARREKRIVLAFDLDFGELLARESETLPSVILFRLRDQRPVAVIPRLLAVLDEEAAALEAGALIVVEESRYRVRRLPIG